MPLFHEPRFKPLPNAYTREKNWTVDEVTESYRVDAYHHTVSAPTHISDTATFDRTRANARAAISHIRAHDSTIPSWLYQAAFDSSANDNAHRACQGVTEASPYPMPSMDYLVTHHKWQDVIMAHVHNDALRIGGVDPDYQNEFHEAVHSVSFPASNICATIANLIRRAGNHIEPDNSLIVDDASYALREAAALFALIEELADQPPPTIGDAPVDVHETGNDHADWEDVLEQIAAWSAMHGDEGNEWADMSIKRHPLTQRIQGFMGKRRRRRLTDAGAALTRPDRIMTDGLCFDAKGNRRDVVGAVLIDNSGSMSFDANDVEQLVQAAPGVTIAHYSGSGTHGVLEIVCEKGKRATTDALSASYGGNGVDGPALRWLAEQQGPRVWVSDGLVTGKYDSTSIALVTDCMNTCRNADITRVPDIDVLTNWVQEQRSKSRGR